MVQEQTNELVRAQRIPLPVHATNAVGIPVRDEAKIVRMPV
jgi:hypothetical protein